jgi:hypothetical protein|tara:strand:- start:3064 stop:3753 length:690 start_codon:yes stop_codon:yes gene_type:complete
MNILKYKFLFLIVISIDISAIEIKDYIARYSFESDEISIEGIRKLATLGDGYELSFKAKNIFAKLEFNSSFVISDDQIITKSYKVKIKPKFVNRDQVVDFNYEKKLITALGRNSWNAEFNPSIRVLDPLNAQIQIRLNLLKGIKEFSIKLVEIKNGVLEDNFYKVIGKELCAVGKKNYECIVLKRSRKKEGRETIYYLAPDLDYMFLKIIDNGPEQKQKLELIEILSLG